MRTKYLLLIFTCFILASCSKEELNINSQNNPAAQDPMFARRNLETKDGDNTVPGAPMIHDNGEGGNPSKFYPIPGTIHIARVGEEFSKYFIPPYVHDNRSGSFSNFWIPPHREHENGDEGEYSTWYVRPYIHDNRDTENFSDFYTPPKNYHDNGDNCNYSNWCSAPYAHDNRENGNYSNFSRPTRTYHINEEGCNNSCWMTNEVHNNADDGNFSTWN